VSAQRQRQESLAEYNRLAELTKEIKLLRLIQVLRWLISLRLGQMNVMSQVGLKINKKVANLSTAKFKLLHSLP
jgi:hypothetical protein